MFQSFIKLAFRNILRKKGFTLLNIIGLAMGIVCCLLIFEYVAHERSYDRFIQNADRIYRVQDEEYQSGRLVVSCAAAMPGVAPALRGELPEIENACRLFKAEFLLVNDALNVKFNADNSFYADPEVLDMFQIKLVEGDPATALSGEGKIILSSKEAKRYFGDENPVGKILNVHSKGNLRPLKVTGVFKDCPSNSHIKLNVIASYETYKKLLADAGAKSDILETSFDWTDFYTYILLKKGTDVKKFASKLPSFIDRHYNDLPKNKNSGDRYSLSLMPLTNIHLYSHYTEEMEANGDGQSVTFLFVIAFFIIGIAWINYVNLGTARSLDRAKEVGMRKVLGALRSGVLGQLMMESVVLNALALLIALLLAFLINPFFINLAGRNMSPLFSMPFEYWLIFIAVFLAGTFTAGFYPALIMSRFKPAIVLKGVFKNATSGLWLRKALIIGQFTASATLIAGTMIVYRQMTYMRNHQLGVDINHTLVINGPFGSLPDSIYDDVYHSFKDQVIGITGIKSVTASSDVMGKEILWSTNWSRLHNNSQQVIDLFHLGVDDDFIKSYGLKIIAGRQFSSTFGGEKKSIILNETAVKRMGYPSPQASLGEMLSGGQQGLDSMTVVGVVADYHNEGLQKMIQPLVLLYHRDRRHYYSIKMEGDETAATVLAVKKVWERFFPADPYDYFFLDDFFNQQYDENQRFAEVFALFAALAIAIACFGLLGMSAYNVVQRTKEIGIRKVLGASMRNLLFILSQEFIILVIIAFMIAVPITWFTMNNWLQNFAYRINIGWWVFIVSGLISIFIALTAVGHQALKAILANPIKSLRTE